MRIALIGPLPPPSGGMANQTLQLQRLLQEEGVDVELVQINAPYRPQWVSAVRGLRAVARLLPYLATLWHAMGRADVAHLMANSGWSWHLFAAPAIWIGRLRGTPVVVNYRGGFAGEFMARQASWVRFSMRRAARLIVPSGFLRAAFAGHGMPADIVPNIVDTERFKPVDDLAGVAPVILVARNLEPIYDNASAIRAFARVKARVPGAQLVVAGSGPEESSLRQQVESLGLLHCVRFTGRVDAADMPALYRSAQVSLNPSLVDNMPNSVLEALAAGVPVVSTRVGGVPYIVEHDQNALLVAPGDADDMAEALVRILSDPVLADRLLKAGLETVQRYTWPTIKPTLFKVYEEVMHPQVDPDHIELAVFSSLFPSAARPAAGLFVRERMFRVARHRPLAVVSPQPWFPGQSLIRLIRRDYRPQAPALEIQQGIRVYHPRYLSIPVLFRRFDNYSMAVCSFLRMRQLKRQGARLIDAHFAYPDGEAATRLGRWLDLPVTITLRGTEVPHSKNPALRPHLARTLKAAHRVFSVSDSLRQLALHLGVPVERTEVIGNGIDIARFYPVDRAAARQRFGVPENARVLISVGGLVERKGMHRVIDVLPALRERHSDLHYLIVGGGGPEGDMRAELEARVGLLGLKQYVHFLGALPPDELKWPLSASDAFVLSTRNEGWANVFLEAMACGLPVVATDVGGNAEVVCRPEFGTLVPFGDAAALTTALDDALTREWDRAAILDYARDNHWDKRVAQLLRAFDELMSPQSRQPELAVK